MNTISDDVFRNEADKYLKILGYGKKERNIKIGLALIESELDRNWFLDDLACRARHRTKSAPMSAQEQQKFVEWFKQAYPEDLIVMIRNDGTRTAAEKIHQMTMGLCPGAADLYIPRWHIWLEMKRKKGYSVSDNQNKFCQYVQAIGDWYILGIGFEDAREKVLNIINTSTLLSK
jgi:hypothetical protein